MSTTPARLALGFVAGSLSHLVVQGAYGSLLYAAKLLPTLPWSLNPVPPFGVPQSVSLAFWAGLWGLAYAALEPWLKARLGRWHGALFLGAVALTTHWFIAQPLKGRGFGGGFQLAVVPIEIGFGAVFGIGIAAIFWAGLMLLRPRTHVAPSALRG